MSAADWSNSYESSDLLRRRSHGISCYKAEPVVWGLAEAGLKDPERAGVGEGELVGSTATRFRRLLDDSTDFEGVETRKPASRPRALFPICSQIFTALLFFVAIASFQEQLRTFRIRFHSVNGMILLDAEVNGKPATLLLDTGANDSTVDARSIGFSKNVIRQSGHYPSNFHRGVGKCDRLDVRIDHGPLTGPVVAQFVASADITTFHTHQS